HVEPQFKPKNYEDYIPKDRTMPKQDMPTIYEDWISRSRTTRYNKFGNNPPSRTTEDYSSKTSGGKTVSVTKTVSTMPKAEDTGTDNTKMSEKYNKDLEKAEKEGARPIVVSTGGNNPKQPWYMKNRPYGPPRSPDQDKVA